MSYATLKNLKLTICLQLKEGLQSHIIGLRLHFGKFYQDF